nr:hypothetical protein [Candidatus Sigynarchaeota archaeon]
RISCPPAPSKSEGITWTWRGPRRKCDNWFISYILKDFLAWTLRKSFYFIQTFLDQARYQCCPDGSHYPDRNLHLAGRDLAKGFRKEHTVAPTG